jgi:aryl-alcohol dehydrogenase-like predicted oxidoreductase
VSEWRAEQIVDACRTADAWHAYRPISNQPQYSILRRGVEKAVLPVCEREGLGQIVFSPLAQGVLTGKYSGGKRTTGTRAADQERNGFMEAFLRPEVLAKVDALRTIAGELGCSTAQLALAWCLRRANVSSVIVGATRPEQLDENAKASGLRIPAEAEARIDALFSGGD